MTIEDAKKLKVGDMLFMKWHCYSNGAIAQAKITSIKTWKTRPNDISIGCKFGLWCYFKIDQEHLNDIAKVPENEARY